MGLVIQSVVSRVSGCVESGIQEIFVIQNALNKTGLTDVSILWQREGKWIDVISDEH